MKVGILTLASRNQGGIYQYTLTLLEALKTYSGNFSYIQITNDNFPQLLDDCIIIKDKRNFVRKIKGVLYTYTGVSFGDMLGNYDHSKLKELELIISPIISLIPYYMRKPYIVTIHDFQHKYYPEFFTLREKIERSILYKTGQKARIVICESEYVKKDIQKFLGVSAHRIIVLPSPPPSYIKNIKLEQKRYLTIKEKYGLPDNYLFYPAQFWYHKNHVKLLESLNILKKKYTLTIPLVLVGSKKDNFENVMNKIKELNLEDQVKYLGYVPDEDMPYLYKLATALVMPTLFESVSLPIWEAFYLGCPVISSNVCALPEQVGDAGLIFDPHNPEDIAEKIVNVWTNVNLREELVKKGYQRIKNLTLENYAKEWERVIYSAIFVKMQKKKF